MRFQRRKARRPAAVFLCILLLFAGGFARLADVSSSYALRTAGMEAGKRKIRLETSRGNIYDRHMRPLVNTKTQNMVVSLVSPDGALTGAPAVYPTDRPVTEDGRTKTYVRIGRSDGNPPAAHLIGYLDADGTGICGIERSYDRILKEAGGALYAAYSVNGLGQAMAGEGLDMKNENYGSKAGVMLTLDADMQRILEGVMQRSGIRTGAAVILDVQSFEILALVSVPVFDVRNLSASLRDPDLPFLNRALSAYPVGSVFKPFIAAAALENGVEPDGSYRCTGGVNVGGVAFSCYRNTAHGTLDLSGAIAASCNSYFIELAADVGPQALSAFCEACGFGREIRLTGDLVCDAGVLPDAGSLSPPAALANFAFGQGEVLATPLQLAAAYAVIANGGIYREPTLLKYLIDEAGEPYAYYQSEIESRVMSPDVCAALTIALGNNMLEGTGKNGASVFVSSAGKTATAQTGRYDENGVERLCTWFCGFAPEKAPRYAIAVFNEHGSAASVDCAPVFRSILDSLYDAQMFE